MALNKTDWISVEDKVRILEYKIRLDLVQNAARGTPEIRFDAIAAYRPKDLNRGKALVARPEDLLPRFHAIDDDGHTVKVARSLAVCRELCEPYADRPWKKVKSDDVWLKMHYTLLDGTEGGEEEGGRWVRAAGFDESWEVRIEQIHALQTRLTAYRMSPTGCEIRHGKLYTGYISCRLSLAQSNRPHPIHRLSPPPPLLP